jgi:hypothetical protein
MMNMRGTGGRAAVQKALNPLFRYRVSAIHRTKKSPTNGCVGISIPASHDSIHYTFLYI